ncbi:MULTISPECIES: hypothetical protein [Ramlibacter]|uniref:Uncharacterized protein n=1 Tax=Ramlibacter aquaticus TaxID=2780094 RepID=A0ABR9SA22_9BURK|nr:MULTISPECIES: hypothetical protein [Ramlibacter]MBE7939195.1 hypothetical protein [Ramlibacter aquaticus]
MLDGGLDQAAGLRALMAPPALGVLAFPLAEHQGPAPWIAQLAQALASLGRRTLVVDAGRGAVTSAFGLRPRLELMDLLQGDHAFDEVAQPAAGGVWVLRADRGVEAFAASGEPSWRLLEAFSRLQQGFDELLLAMPAGELACLAAPQESVPIVSLFPGTAGTVHAYGLVKQLAEGFGYRRFACVVQGAADEAQARTDHARIAAAALRFLDVDVRYAGRVDSPDAAGLRLAAQSLLETAVMPLH